MLAVLRPLPTNIVPECSNSRAHLAYRSFDPRCTHGKPPALSPDESGGTRLEISRSAACVVSLSGSPALSTAASSSPAQAFGFSVVLSVVGSRRACGRPTGSISSSRSTTPARWPGTPPRPTQRVAHMERTPCTRSRRRGRRLARACTRTPVNARSRLPALRWATTQVALGEYSATGGVCGLAHAAAPPAPGSSAECSTGPGWRRVRAGPGLRLIAFSPSGTGPLSNDRDQDRRE